MDIDFNGINKGIEQRENGMRILRAQIGTLIVVGPELQAVIDPAAEKDAREIMTRINALKKSNAEHGAFRDHALDLLRANNIPVAGTVCLGEHISNLRNQIYYQVQALGKRFLAGELTSAEYEAQAAAIRDPLEARAAEIEAIETKLANYWAGIAKE